MNVGSVNTIRVCVCINRYFFTAFAAIFLPCKTFAPSRRLLGVAVGSSDAFTGRPSTIIGPYARNNGTDPVTGRRIRHTRAVTSRNCARTLPRVHVDRDASTRNNVTPRVRNQSSRPFGWCATRAVAPSYRKAVGDGRLLAGFYVNEHYSNECRRRRRRRQLLRSVSRAIHTHTHERTSFVSERRPRTTVSSRLLVYFWYIRKRRFSSVFDAYILEPLDTSVWRKVHSQTWPKVRSSFSIYFRTGAETNWRPPKTNPEIVMIFVTDGSYFYDYMNSNSDFANE